MWSEGVERSRQARAAVQGPGISAPADDVAALLGRAWPVRFVVVRVELVAVVALWLGVAAAESIALLVTGDGALRHWRAASAFFLYITALQWFVSQRGVTSATAIPAAEIVPARRAITSAAWGAVVVGIAIIAAIALLAHSADDAGLLIALQISTALGTASSAAPALRKTRRIERRGGTDLLRLSLKGLRIDGRRPTWTQRKILAKARFADTQAR